MSSPTARGSRAWRAIAESIESTRWAAEIWDAEWRLAWVSEEIKAILGVDEDADVGYGKHILEARYGEPWRSSVDRRDARADDRHRRPP